MASRASTTRSGSHRPAIPVGSSTAYGSPGKLRAPSRRMAAPRTAGVTELVEDLEDQINKARDRGEQDDTSTQIEDEVPSPGDRTFTRESTVSGIAKIISPPQTFRPDDDDDPITISHPLSPFTASSRRVRIWHVLQYLWYNGIGAVLDSFAIIAFLFTILLLLSPAFKHKLLDISSAISSNTTNHSIIREYRLPPHLASFNPSIIDNFRNDIKRDINDLRSGVQHDISGLRQEITSLDAKLDSQASLWKTQASQSGAHSRSTNPLVDGSFSRVNYFSTGLGAVINPYLTSPVKLDTVFVRGWFRPYSTNVPVSHAPVEALQSFEDIGDCFCGPRSSGMLQLAVLLPRVIVPTHLVISHIERDRTLSPGAAPKDLELWVEVADPEIRDMIRRDAQLLVQTQDGAVEAGSQTDYQTARALDRDRWVRIGAWRYESLGDDHVQAFRIPILLEIYGIAADQVVIRANSNWGQQDYTCLYNLKLFGMLAAEQKRDRPMTLA
ncbi:hypothetical protein MMC25_005479 [Agyrium rufum]|nr:hypothetical protein [Agyrium rufum]